MIDQSFFIFLIIIPTSRRQLLKTSPVNIKMKKKTQQWLKGLNGCFLESLLKMAVCSRIIIKNAMFVKWYKNGHFSLVDFSNRGNFL